MLESIHLFETPGLVNAGKVNGNIYRGADPAPEGYKTLKDMGIKTVLNLSHGREEEELAPYGIKELYSPMNFFGAVDEHKMKEAIGRVLDASNYPLYVHCAQGSDRTGMVLACYRIETGWSNESAINEMQSFGFHYVWSHFLEYVQNYRKA
jgi:protein tyrosine/serine phosphatase